MLSGDNQGFDSHCHLHFNHFDDDIEKVVENSALLGIRHIMIPSVDETTAEKSACIAEKYGLYSSAAFHPGHLPEKGSDENGWLGIRRVLLRPRTVAVGETGLDYHHETFPHDKQIQWFQRHMELAGAIGYPLIVHSRGAEAEVLDQLPASLAVPVILHCWGGNELLTDQAVSRGYYIGIGGPLTYRKNSSLRETIARVPKNRLLCETDSPFLSPEPYRGQRNEPAFMRFVIQGIRELWGSDMSIGSTSYILWENAMKAYRLHPENRRADIVYRLGDSLYVNLTSRCMNSCSFCIKKNTDGLSDYYLVHKDDPSENLVLSTIEAFPIEDCKELVFCGFGEPTLRSELLVKCAKLSSARGVKTRLNTNGLCSSFLSREQVQKLLSSIDSISISLNASGSLEYNRICPSTVENPWEHLMSFISLAKASGTRTQVSAVSGSGADMERVNALADRLQLPLRVRS
jgi:TatD DNase family protein